MTKQLPRWYILTVTLLIVALIAYYFFNILVYMLLALAISFVGRPIMNFITGFQVKGKNLPRWIGAIITILILLVIFFVGWAIFIPIIVSQARALADIDYTALQHQLEGPMSKLEEFVFRYSLIDTEGRSLADYFIFQIKHLINLTFFSDVFNNLMSFTMEVMIGFFSVLFILFFFLKDRDTFYNIINTLTPDQHEAKMAESIESIKKLLTRYFIGILVQLSIIFTIVSTGLYFVGLENFLLIAFLAAFFNIIPYVGPFIGYILGLILGISVSLDISFATELLPLVLKITAVFFVAQLVDNFFSQPFIFSNSVKAHPLEIFILIVAAGSVGGVMAMVLAIPTYTVFRVMAKEFFSDSKIIRNLTKDL